MITRKDIAIVSAIALLLVAAFYFIVFVGAVWLIKTVWNAV